MLVALGITGGIAAYKACEVVRGLTRAGADVQVIMTANATRFITPLTLQTLSGRRVITHGWDPDDEAIVRHIDLSRTIDVLVVAPATANALAKFARGIADDFLSTFYVSVTAPVVLAPAMNTRMWLHPATRENLAALRARGVQVVEPESGWLAEREIGWGRLAEPERIVRSALAAARRSSQLEGRTVLVTAGPTREPIDPVRYLSNRSSGRMGYALAGAAARRGARVVLVSGPVAEPPPFGVETVPVTTAAEMLEAVERRAGEAQAIFMTAAVADWAARPAAGKIKRGAGTLTLELDENPDILARLGRDKGERLLVGFAAETEDVEAGALEKLRRKNLDWIVANDVSRPDIGFDAPDNAVVVLGRGGERVELPKSSKTEIAERILDTVFGGAGGE